MSLQPGGNHPGEHAGAEWAAVRGERDGPGVHDAGLAAQRGAGRGGPRPPPPHGHPGREALHVLPGLRTHSTQTPTQGTPHPHFPQCIDTYAAFLLLY